MEKIKGHSRIKQLENYNRNVGDSVLIKDKHLLKLTGIEVSISAPEGTLLEQGKAVPCELDWQYRATVRNPSPGGTQVAVTDIDRLKRSVAKIVRMDG